MEKIVIAPQYRLRVKQRLGVVAYALEHGLKGASRRFGLDRKTVRAWVRRWRAAGVTGLLPRYPTIRPTRLPDEVVRRIEHARRELRYGAPRTQIWLRRVHKRHVSIATIQRTFRKLGLPRLARGRSRTPKPRQLTLFEKPHPGDSVQVDVKVVKIAGQKAFQYTALDDCTRLRVLRLYRRQALVALGRCDRHDPDGPGPELVPDRAGACCLALRLAGRSGAPHRAGRVRTSMLLSQKSAVIYGAGGALGGAVARAFAREGARLFLASRTLAKVRAVADEIAAARGTAEAAQVDAHDEQAVERHLDAVARTAGGIDILFNAIGMEDVQGTALVDMRVEDFLHPVLVAAKTQFHTARAAARHMAERGSGVIMTITAGPPEPIPYIGGFGSACGVVEGLWRGLAAELGSKGVRVICLRSAGSPDTPDVRMTFELHAKATGVTYEECLAAFSSTTLLKRLPLAAEVANVAAMMASDGASAMTGAFVHVTCGSRE